MARQARWPKSYLWRQGQATAAQRRALREHWMRFGVDCRYGEVLDLDRVFGRSADRVLDVGFGHGATMIARAQHEPERDVLGVEVHRPGVGAALAALSGTLLTNVRVVRHDALAVLHDHLRESSINEVQICFPEPWPHDPHRRLLRPDLFAIVALRARPGLRIVLATDIAEYAEHADRVAAGAGWRVERVERPSWRPITPYEQRGLDAGRTVEERAYWLP